MLDPEYIAQIQHEHRGWTQDVQQEGYTAALDGESRDNNPYGQKVGCNHWIYGFMLGTADKRRQAHVRR